MARIQSKSCSYQLKLFNILFIVIILTTFQTIITVLNYQGMNPMENRTAIVKYVKLNT